jgi:hypothetical protein
VDVLRSCRVVQSNQGSSVSSRYLQHDRAACDKVLALVRIEVAAGAVVAVAEVRWAVGDVS